MFFVVSTGRAGSKLISHLLSAVDGCTCEHEPEPALILEASAYRYGDISQEETVALLRETRSPRLNGDVYCESNQTLSLLIPVLVRVFPQARFIWLMRNGRDMVASAYSKQWYSGHSENHDRYEDCTPLEKRWIDGRIQGDRCGDLSAAAWASLDRFGHCCWYWYYVNDLIARDLAQYAPNRYYRIHLEAIDAQLPALLRWMGLKTLLRPAARRINPGKRAAHPWSEWSEAQRDQFEHWCAEQMDKFYPGWRAGNGEWEAINYRQRTDLLAGIARHYRLVRHVNGIFAPN
jgi:hypothetical protein